MCFFCVCRIKKPTYTYIGTVNSTYCYTLWTLYRFHFKGIGANIELQVCNETVDRTFYLFLG
jgi:hypothetical protein